MSTTFCSITTLATKSRYLMRFSCSTGSPLRSVWSKNSCGLSLVVFEQATKPFTILNQTVIPALWPGLWKEQHIALALMIALLVVMVHILVEHVPQGVFAEQHHP